MPQLSSGRHVGFAPPNILEVLRSGADFQRYGVIVVYRLTVSGVETLPRIIPVVRFEEAQGTPPDAPAYLAGHTLQDVLDGEVPGWSEAEREELREWLAGEPRARRWLQDTYEEIEAAIRDNLLWTSEWMTGEPEECTRQ